MRRFAVIALVLWTSVASAQDLMTRAREAADAGRLVEARDLLIRLVEEDPSPGAAANLAMIQRSLGELLDAQRLLERLAAGEFGELEAERQEQATSMLREVRSEVATLSIRVSGAEPGSRIRLDGRVVGSTNAQNELVVPSNPGRHVVAAESETRIVEQEVEVPVGGAASVQLVFAPTPREVAEDPSNEPIVESRPRSSAVAIGLGIAAATVAIAVAVVLAIVLSGGESLPSQPDNFLGSARL